MFFGKPLIVCLQTGTLPCSPGMMWKSWRTCSEYIICGRGRKRKRSPNFCKGTFLSSPWIRARGYPVMENRRKSVFLCSFPDCKTLIHTVDAIGISYYNQCAITFKAFSFLIPLLKGDDEMEAIVCQNCDEVITYVDGDKSGTLYGTCQGCDDHCEEKE